MFNYEKFITEIKSNQCIWNVHNCQYQDKQMKAAAWTSITETMFSDWDKFSEADQDKKGNNQ